MDAQPRVFISYCHVDEAWKDRVISQLGVLAHEERLSIWDDRQIAGGDDWLPAIEAALDSCRVALLLISASFLTSKFILGTEVPRLLQRREQDGVRVMPVILKPCVWTRVSWLKSIQARPKDGKPLSGMSEHDADAALAGLVAEIDDLLARNPNPHPNSSPKIDLTKLPHGAPDFLGRETELKLLDDAWADAGHTQIVELVAAGGVGKTSLVKRWLDRLKADGWRGAQRVYGWSFYSQGTSDDRQASDDPFLSAALDWFGVRYDPALSPWDKGKRLAEAVAATRTLLVLDGVEPLQYPPGPLAGELRAPGLQALLTHLATSGQPGLCLLTTRERIQDLAEYERCDDHPHGVVIRHDLSNLSETDGARLLHKLGVCRAGVASIGPNDVELRQASREVHGHALTLSLLGGLLAAAYDGDIRQRDKVEFEQADAELRGGHAFKVMAAYEKWFQREGEKGARELATLRLLGFFDRPADAGCLAALRQAPPIPGLTEPLVNLSTVQWNITLNRLKTIGLLEPSSADASPLDAHPLVREYLANALRKRQPDAWREGHRRLYEHLKAGVPHHPDGLAGLQPLYQAVAHGCQAGLSQQACVEVYEDRILRGEGFYNIKKLGAYGTGLAVVACFFEEPWQRLTQELSTEAQAWLFNEAFIHLRALGRLNEALDPIRAALVGSIQQENWKSAAVSASNLSELEQTLGRLTDAVRYGGESVAFADHNGETFWRMGTRTTLADALHQQGQRQLALDCFHIAETIQADRGRPYPVLLCTLPGFRYCDLLLAIAERAAWRLLLAPANWSDADQNECLNVCRDTKQRASKALSLAHESDVSHYSIALDHLTLGRVALFQVVLKLPANRDPQAAIFDSTNELNTAVNGLRDSGRLDELPKGLLPRAWLHVLTGNPTAAHVDLDEAWQIASRGGMRLHMADIHLHRARLFRERAELQKARVLIEECGYWRRREELEDAEAVAGGW